MTPQKELYAYAYAWVTPQRELNAYAFDKVTLTNGMTLRKCFTAKKK